MYNKLLSLVLFLSITLFAQQLDLTGKVLDKDNNPLFGVIATLKNMGISDTTDSDGIYHLTKLSVDIKDQPAKPTTISKFDNSRLWFSVERKSQVSIDIYNLNGRKVFTALNQKLSSGNYSINPISSLSPQMLIVQLKIDDKVFNYKVPSLSKNEKSILNRYGDNESSGVRASMFQDVLDTLDLIKDDQLLSTTNIIELIDTLPDLFIVQRDIYGDLTLVNETVNKIEAVITGDDITGTKLTKLWHNTVDNSYSGFVYFVYSIGVKNYNIFVKIYNTDDKYIGKSLDIPFNSMAGDVHIPSFNAENATPSIFIGNDTTVSIYDTIHLTCIALDSIGSRGISKWEWNINGAGFIETSTSDTSVIVPDGSRGQFTSMIRVTDNDGNVAVDSITITVVKDVPIPTASIATSEVSINDDLNLQGTATDKYGKIVKWEWDAGNTGTFIETTPNYVAVAPSNEDNTYLCILRVTDDDGNVAVDSITVTVVKDVPILTAVWEPSYSPSFLQGNTGSPNNRRKTLEGEKIDLHGSVINNYGDIVKWEWDIGGTGTFVTVPDSNFTPIAPSVDQTFYNLPCILRITDDDGHIALDTVNVEIIELDNDMLKIHSKNKSFQIGEGIGYLKPVEGAHQVIFTYDFWVNTTSSYSGDSYYSAVLQCNELSKSNNLDTAYTYDSYRFDSTDNTTWISNLKTDISKNGYRIITEAEWEYLYVENFDIQQSIIIGDENESTMLNDWLEESYTYDSDPEINRTGPLESTVAEEVKVKRRLINRLGTFAYNPYNFNNFIIVRRAE